MSADPFTRPCDYFLFTCDSDWKRGRQRGQGRPGDPQNQRRNPEHSERKLQSQERVNRRTREEKVLDRKTLLLQYLSEILGRSLEPTLKQIFYMCTAFLFVCLCQILMRGQLAQLNRRPKCSTTPVWTPGPWRLPGQSHSSHSFRT